MAFRMRIWIVEFFLREEAKRFQLAEENFREQSWRKERFILSPTFLAKDSTNGSFKYGS